MIPKNIFQTWYTKDLPHEIQVLIDQMKQKNSDYNYYLYTDEEMDNFVRENYPGEIYECYSKINLIVAKTDFWRYLILYKYGGVYLDIDSMVEIHLGHFIRLEDSAIISRECGRDTFTQWCLIFEQNHPILLRTIEFIVDNIKNNRYSNDIIQMTGPSVFSKAIKSIHQEFFNEDLNVDEFDINYDRTFTHCCYSYRVYSNDYRPYITFKHDQSHLLYINKPHWTTLHNEPVLKNS
jgi:mannosyltransferase OCH1-like enzyme